MYAFSLQPTVIFMSDQFPPAPPPPPPPPPPQQPQHGYQQQAHPQQGYGQPYAPPPVKTGMSGGVKALLIALGIFFGLGVLAFAGFLVVGAVVVNEANDIVKTASSDLDEDLSDLAEDEDEPSFSFDEEDEDEVDLATWCSTVDDFDAFTRASTAGFTADQVTDKILTVDEMIDEVRDTGPSDLETEIDEVLVPFEETVALFESVDFDATQITAEDQEELNESFEAALPSVISVRQTCLDEGISVFENND